MKTICIGENLVDIYQSNESTLACTGGAPLNVACYLANYGMESYMITRISSDEYGKQILSTIKKYNVKEDYITIDNEHLSTKSIVTIDDKGDRSFTFNRDNTADILLDEKDINEEMFNDVKVLHFCSVGLVDSPSKRAHLKAIKIAKEKGIIISFDVNIRRSLYSDDETCKSTIFDFIKYANIIKLTDEELEFLTGDSKSENSAKVLFRVGLSADLVIITRGERGSALFDRYNNFISIGAKNVDVIDTTGAGDCFSACYIKYILDNGFSKNANDYKNCLKFASEECAKICSKKGAL